MARETQGSRSWRRGNSGANRPRRSIPETIRPWLVVVAVLIFVLLCHVDLLLAPGATGSHFDNPERAIRSEFPNPFLDSSLSRAWTSGSRHAFLALHLLGVLVCAVFLRRLTGSWPAALAGAAVYGVHPAHLALVAEGARWAPIAAPILIFGAGVLLFSPRRFVPIAGGVGLALGVILDPAALGLPVFLLLLRWLAREEAISRRVLIPAFAGAGVAGLAALAGAWRFWPHLPLESTYLPPGPLVEAAFENTLLTLGRAVRHLFDPALFPGVDYGRGEVPLAWTWADPGAVALAVMLTAVGALLILTPGRRAGTLARATWGGVLAVVVASALFPLPGLLAALHTEEGFAPAQLLATTFLPAFLVAVAVRAALGVRPGPSPARKILAVAVTVLVVAPPAVATFLVLGQLRTEDRALRAAAESSDRSGRLQRRVVEMELRQNRNKLDLLHRLQTLCREQPDDARTWAALGRFEWVIRRFPRAVKAFGKAVALAPDRRAYRYDLAAVHLLARQPEKALRVLEPLSQDAKDRPEVAALIRLARARAGRPAPWSDQDAADAPPVVLRAQGMILAEAGRFEEALALLDRARIRRPRDALLDSYRGWCLLELGRTREALDVLQFDALRDESGFLAHKLLGDYFSQKGPHQNRSAAFHHYRYFLKHDPGSPDRERIDAALEAIQKGER